jgi:hypothetical protein
MRFAPSAPSGFVALLGALALAPGCIGPPSVAGFATIYPETVPANVYAYPHVWYEGSYAYLVGNRWYYPTTSGWVVLRSEPPELYRYRSTWGYPRGPVDYGRTYRQAAPPAPPPYEYYPPPAERVR